MMTPKSPIPRSDASNMIGMLNTPTRQLRALRSDPEGRSRCEHEYTGTSQVAGMERYVCEICGHVSIKRVGDTVTKGTVSGVS